MKALGRRVVTDIAGNPLCLEHVPQFRFVGRLVDETSFLQDIENVHALTRTRRRWALSGVRIGDSPARGNRRYTVGPGQSGPSFAGSPSASVFMSSS